MLRWPITTLRRKVPGRWPVLMRATTGSNTHIAMAWRWSAMLRPPAIPLTARGFLLLCALRECFATNSSAIPIGIRQDIAMRNNISASFRACHTVEGWYAQFFKIPSPESAALRAKAMPLIAEDPTRVPDHILSGPDLPLNEKVRARFFGEC